MEISATVEGNNSSYNSDSTDSPVSQAFLS